MPRRLIRGVTDGGIGLAVAERADAFGMRVVGLDPAPKGRPEYVEEIYGQGEIVPLLEIQPRREALTLENVRRFVAGEALLNVVDHVKGYVVSVAS